MNIQVSGRGALPSIIRNAEHLYEGDLKHYFQVLFRQAQNVEHPYHNFRHMLHVTVMCYFACEYHRAELTQREIRNVLIAALFHDFDHSGMAGNDDLNILRAVRALDKCLLPEDVPHRDDIVAIVNATEYPYRVASEDLPLAGLIIRDADMSQSFSEAWLQQVVFGLAAEWGKTPLELLKAQVPFNKSAVFHTAWGRATFPQSLIDEKISEAEELIALLE